MRPRLIATDLDGTFLGADASPHTGNISAALAAKEAGIEVVIATGRPRRWLRPITALAELNPMVISNNGAAVGRLNAEKPELMHPMEPDHVVEFLSSMPAEMDVAIAVEYEWSWGRTASYHTVHYQEEQLVAEVEDLLAAGPVLKVLVRTEHASTEDLSEMALEAAQDQLECTFSWSDAVGTVELSAPGVTKGSALAEILASRGIEPGQCAAFGDMPNDLTMLQLVGAPYVMADAHPSMLEHGFTRIGAHHEGAVGDVIRGWL